jgi:hypothetical protein
MECNAIEVRYGLVDMDGRGTTVQLASPDSRNWDWACIYPENLSVRTDWMRAFW